MAEKRYDRDFLSRLDKGQLRRAFRLLQWQDKFPTMPCPPAAQYDGLATTGAVRAEYKRRGWKAPRGGV